MYVGYVQRVLTCTQEWYPILLGWVMQMDESAWLDSVYRGKPRQLAVWFGVENIILWWLYCISLKYRNCTPCNLSLHVFRMQFFHFLVHYKVVFISVLKAKANVLLFSMQYFSSFKSFPTTWTCWCIICFISGDDDDALWLLSILVMAGVTEIICVITKGGGGWFYTHKL